MRTTIAATAVLLSVVGIFALAPSMGAVNTEAATNQKIFYLDHRNPSETGAVTSICGTQPRYHLSTDAPVPAGKAYLSRAVLEVLRCETRFGSQVSVPFTANGSVQVFFPLGCDLIGAIQSIKSLGLSSVQVDIQKNNAVVATGQTDVSSLPVSICEGTLPGADPYYHVGVVTNSLADKGAFRQGDWLNVSVYVKSVNTECAIHCYWYIQTGASANVTFNVPPVATTPTTPPTTPPTGGANAPECHRESPAEPTVTGAADAPTALTAACTDADGDLDHGNWTVDNTTVATDELSGGMDDSTHEFIFDQCGVHEIVFTGVDAAGHVGTPAVWTVTIAGCETTPPPNAHAPECHRDQPPQAQVARSVGTAFALQAACSDPDADLDHGVWTVDGLQVGQEPLSGASDTASHQFQFAEAGTHTVRFTPTDQAGNVGSPAIWTVTVGAGGTSTPPPTTTPIPFFPSATGIALAMFGALGGTLLVLRRRA